MTPEALKVTLISEAPIVGDLIKFCAFHAFRSKYPCIGIEMRDVHNQTVVRIAGLYCPGICLIIFGLKDDDADQAITVATCPIEVGNPLFTSTS